MPEIQIPIIGTMNGDDPPEVMPKGTHRTAYNLIFRGDKGNKRPENMPGTRQISFVLPSGTNVCIGAFYDAVNARVFYMNYNSSGTHGIYIFNVLTEIVQTVIQNGTSTNGDVLGFDPTVPIHSINIIYGDPNDGDIITFVDCLKRPTKINVQRYLSSTYSLIKRSFIDVAKEPPQQPLRCTYENDTDVTINNLRNSLFQFRYRYVYDDNEKPVYSSGSIVPLPNQPSIQLTNPVFTNNARISLFVNTGDVNVKKIEIIGRQIKDGAVGAYFLITSLDKSKLSIPDNDIYNFKFKNDNVYNFIDPQEAVLLYDYVPQQANCQELLNGNVLAYAGIKEGYDLFNPNISLSDNQNTGPFFMDYNGLLFFATINGLESGSTGTVMKVYLYGTGTNISGNVTTLNNAYGTFVINAVNGSGASIGTSVVNQSDSVTVSSLLSLLSAGLVANGWTQTSLSGNVLTMNFSAGATLYSSGVNVASNTQNDTTSLFAYPVQSAYNYGIVYYDQKGRTNGVITNTSGVFTIPSLATNKYPQPRITINHRPPVWAYYYEIVRTKNLTYNKYLYWISKSAYSDLSSAVVTDQYAYINIDNISYYNQTIGATQGVVSYDFSQGDRIKFITRYNSSGGVANALSFDYEILGLVQNPVVAGLAQLGNFIKIYYPTADIGINMKFDGTSEYQNYQILIYNYTKHVDNTDNFYFEFGKRFGVGNPGTNNAFHIGLNQTQSSNLLTPAIIDLTNGDYFFRSRNVPVGNTLTITSDAYTQNTFNYLSPGFTVANPITTSNYSIQSSTQGQANVLTQGSGDYTLAKAFFANNGSNGIKLRMRGTIPVSIDGGSASALYFQAINPDGTFQLITVVQPISMIPGNVYNIVFDSTIIVQAAQRVHLIISNSTGANQRVSPFSMTIDIIQSILISVLDTSFSDVYNLKISSNSRPVVIDPNAKQTYYSTLFRFSQPYQLGTNINGTNRFYPLNYDVFVKDYGDVIRMKSRQKECRIFQTRKCGTVGVYNKFIKNNSGANQLIVSDTIITPNNIQYYDGNFGIGNQPMGLCSDGYRDYFADPIKGFLLRLSNDGIIPISELYKEQIWAGSNLPKYQTNYPYAYGGYAKILGLFNFKSDKQGEYICVLQNGTGITGSTIAFDERDNSFTSFYSFQPDMLICAGNKLLSWVNGNLYIHDNTSAYNTFYGTRYDSSFEFIMNEAPEDEKEFAAIGFNAPNLWDAPTKGDVNTSYGQQSNIVSQDYDVRSVGMYQGAFWRDMNSKQGLINGDYLKGIWLDVKLSNHSTVFSFIQGIYIILVPDPKTR